MADYQPIDPNRLAELGIDPEKAASTQPKPFKPGGITVNSTQLSSSAATDLGFSNLVKIKVQGDAFYFSVDFAAIQSVTVPDPSEFNGYSAMVWGAGLRLVVKSWAVKGEGSTSIYGLAASAELSQQERFRPRHIRHRCRGTWRGHRTGAEGVGQV